MNIAMLIAGGSGQRMHQDIPKQFLNVYDRPVIIYALQAFQQHPDIDAICVVCLEGWEEILRAYAKQFAITKLNWVVCGGENGQTSIKNGIWALKDETNGNEMTEYIVKSLKTNALGVPNALIDEMVLYKDFLGIQAGSANYEIATEEELLAMYESDV